MAGKGKAPLCAPHPIKYPMLPQDMLLALSYRQHVPGRRKSVHQAIKQGEARMDGTPPMLVPADTGTFFMVSREWTDMASYTNDDDETPPPPDFETDQTSHNAHASLWSGPNATWEAMAGSAFFT